jgi:carbonic anhydrase
MNIASPLPDNLRLRYLGWKKTTFASKKLLHKRLVEQGQAPEAMVISCCDSRVQPASIFESDIGEFFIHRNIANLVPPISLAGDNHGTSAAVEYAVNSLEVSRIIILGHSNCGGVNGCHEMCSGNAPELEQETSFVGRWVDILRPAYERVDHKKSKEEQLRALEHEGIIMSVENLMTFPFVQDAVRTGKLSLHGLWHDISEGNLLFYNGEVFEPID